MIADIYGCVLGATLHALSDLGLIYWRKDLDINHERGDLISKVV